MRSFLVLVLLAGGCGGGDAAPGTVALGDTCTYGSDCAPVQGGEVSCGCAGPGAPTCQASYPLPLICGDRACADNETCLGDAAGTRCVPDATAGESCASTGCLPGTFCGPDLLCQPAHAVGAACDPRDQSTCAAPAFCAPATSTCTAPVAVGAPCDVNAGLDFGARTQCVTGAVCSDLDQICVLPKANGAPCRTFDECDSGYCAHDPGAAGTCQTHVCH